MTSEGSRKAWETRKRNAEANAKAEAKTETEPRPRGTKVVPSEGILRYQVEQLQKRVADMARECERLNELIKLQNQENQLLKGLLSAEWRNFPVLPR